MLISEKLFGLPELQLLRSEKKDGELHLWGRSSLKTGLCPASMEQSSKVLEKRERIVRDLPILGLRVYLHLESRKFSRPSGGCFWEQFSFIRSKSRMTSRYEEYLYDSCRGADIHYVASREGLGDDTVSQIFHLHAKKN